MDVLIARSPAYIPRMQAHRFPRNLLARLDDSTTFPLRSLQAIREAREYLDDLESRALLQARALGATAPEIAEGLGITRQGVHYKLQRLDRDRAVADD